jgi:hypothetical protein
MKKKPRNAKTIFFFFFLFTLPFLAAQDFTITPDDYRIIPHNEGGFDLYIRKKDGVSSIMLFEVEGKEENRGETYPYWRLGRNSGEIWYLADADSEIAQEYSELGQAFHIYIPPVIEYGSLNTRTSVTVPTDKPFSFNIRVFEGMFEGASADNFFIIQNAELTPFSPYTDEAVEEKTPQAQTEDEKEEKTPAAQTIDETEKEKKEGKEITIDVGAGFMYFSPGPAGKISDSRRLLNNYDVNADVSLIIPVNERWGVRAGFQRDALLMNRLFARAVYEYGVFGFEAGLALGLFNLDKTKIKPALSTVFRASIPAGWFSASLAFDYALDRNLAAVGDYTQDAIELYAEFRLPAPLKLFLELSDKTALLKQEYATIGQYWMRYGFGVETVFDMPVAFRVNAGYQDIRWQYAALSVEEYEYESFFVGLTALWRVLPNLTLFLGAEAPVYPWVYPSIGDFADPQAPLLLSVSLGVTWKIGK